MTLFLIVVGFNFSNMSQPDLPDYLIQYVVLRGDLKWPTGALVAQGCHASCAVNHIFRDDPETQRFLADLDRMHVCVLKATDEKVLMDLVEELKSRSIGHKLWIEEPENVASCLAVKPCFKRTVEGLMKHLKLFR
ncbi:putative peptidyl-tRNA hydrolase PTRHD1 [Paramacrobiotus metropolitanus]|uniref:putative peptidyl-tRNA hydrolase PTRHD1 n=1 Tax=Paramacrobiotus metropolitanus TaxID=2943436 RepID=UPI002445EF52|nr:putative peptidyl-tRNA hydrolase PTRHD1 [Paramacrobiotus metropolitanus]